MRAPRLIPQWRRAWRLRSVQAALMLLGLSLLQGIQQDVLPMIQPLLSPTAWPWVSAGFALAIVVFRVLQQLGALDPAATGSEPKEGAQASGDPQ